MNELADQGRLLGSEMTVADIVAFARTRQIDPTFLMTMFQQAGLMNVDPGDICGDRFPI